MFIHMAPTVTPPRLDVLLDAALAVFDELGYAATPVPVIAQRAGVAVGSIYRYVSGKEQLANELYRREKRRMAMALFDGVDLDTLPKTKAHRERMLALPAVQKVMAVVSA